MLDGAKAVRVIRVTGTQDAPITVSLQDLTITNGRRIKDGLATDLSGDGAGIYCGLWNAQSLVATLSITRCTITNHVADVRIPYEQPHLHMHSQNDL